MGLDQKPNYKVSSFRSAHLVVVFSLIPLDSYSTEYLMNSMVHFSSKQIKTISFLVLNLFLVCLKCLNTSVLNHPLISKIRLLVAENNFQF